MIRITLLLVNNGSNGSNDDHDEKGDSNNNNNIILCNRNWSDEPRKKPPYFPLYCFFLIGIPVMVYYNPHISPYNCVVKSLKYSKHKVFSHCSCNTPFPIGIVSYKRQPCISQHYLHLIGSWQVNLPSRTKSTSPPEIAGIPYDQGL